MKLEFYELDWLVHSTGAPWDLKPQKSVSLEEALSHLSKTAGPQLDQSTFVRATHEGKTFRSVTLYSKASGPQGPNWITLSSNPYDTRLSASYLFQDDKSVEYSFDSREGTFNESVGMRADVQWKNRAIQFGIVELPPR